jgi:hypothetical protein
VEGSSAFRRERRRVEDGFMHLRRVAVTLAIWAVVALLAAPTHAKGPCDGDVQRLCADAPEAAGGLVACVREKEADLSPPCKDQLAGVKKRVGPLVATCHYEISLFCSDVSPGDGRIVRCLEEKQDRLSPACKKTVAKRKAP